ncbi:MAG: hypothetical protein A4S09_02400 [Proteobacteria bacterium SG_bin7]|nr:MAG: hypothetical protein A4S09_02400 [Proteobacteria bacterium SG_bin7]
METADFYDLRGKSAMEIKFRGFGSQAFVTKFRAPYEYYEEKLPLPKIGTNFLDLGCGTGIHSIFAARLGYNVTGIDISKKSLEAAGHIADFFHVKNHCSFFATDAYEFLRTSQEFDVIFTSGSLYYFDIRKIILLIKEKLKPNGSFFCIETNGSNWFLNKTRKFRYSEQERDQRTTDHLLKLEDIKYLREQFPVSEVKHFGIYSIPVPPSLSFKFVFHGRKS